LIAIAIAALLVVSSPLLFTLTVIGVVVALAGSASCVAGVGSCCYCYRSKRKKTKVVVYPFGKPINPTEYESKE
jgi:hypothetical protein